MTRGLARSKPVSEGAGNSRTAEPIFSWSLSKRGEGFGQVRVKVIPDFKTTTIIPFLTQDVTPGSAIYADGLKSLPGLSEAGFKHVARNQPLRSELRKGARSAVLLADRAIGNLQQWLIGTYHKVSKVQGLPRRIRFSSKSSQDPSGRISGLLGLGTRRESTTYEQITGARDLNPKPVGPC
jgi:transposase-like protein